MKEPLLSLRSLPIAFAGLAAFEAGQCVAILTGKSAHDIPAILIGGLIAAVIVGLLVFVAERMRAKPTP